MKEKIYCKNKIIGEITFRKDDKKINKVIKIIQRNYPLLKDFFDFEIPLVKIYLLYSQAEINKYWGTKTPPWVCGFTKKKNKIYILSPSVSKKISNYSVNKIYKAVIHELAHLFIVKINTRPLSWVNEGLALFLAGQIKSKRIKKSEWNLLMKNSYIANPKVDWLKVANRGGYVLSYLLVNYIILRYGKNELIKLLKIRCDKNNVSRDLERIFKTQIDKFIENFKRELKFC